MLLSNKKYQQHTELLIFKKVSGKRDSNPRPSAWEADALPTELLPQFFAPPTRGGSENDMSAFMRRRG